MSCTISVSDRPRDIWMIRSDLFRRFVILVEQMEPTTTAVHELLKNAVMVNGISLDAVWAETPAIALQCRDVLCRVARAVCESTAHLDPSDEPPSAGRPTYRTLFCELASILGAWKPEDSSQLTA
ncbi:hypothetical protein [Roseimicrobium sp. ORNL1]|uniref:hypothetical protein n=1 Tax=Roseimicrobium sp. ORNL1 TaxID=2711231 RepID=UPI0013E16203|nr:hypothetical protein [Roseimicrobium sp. ORNL1]QIF03338.1 hypothetical protein G5S37_18015 [Roseimicrobium sp. ORNL1]